MVSHSTAVSLNRWVTPNFLLQLAFNAMGCWKMVDEEPKKLKAKATVKLRPADKVVPHFIDHDQGIVNH